MIFNRRENSTKLRTPSVDTGIEKVVEDICYKFGVTGKGSPIASRNVEQEQKSSKPPFFGIRSRNNTVNSISSSVHSLPSTAGTGHSSSRSSFDGKPFGSDFSQFFEEHRQKTKNGSSRNGRVTRQSSKVSLASTLNKVEDLSDNHVKHGPSYSASEGNLSGIGVAELKYHISSPFGFQHVTHARKEHFSKLDKSTNEDLTAGFLALRANKHSHRELHGIKTKSINLSQFEPDLHKTQSSASLRYVAENRETQHLDGNVTLDTDSSDNFMSTANNDQASQTPFSITSNRPKANSTVNPPPRSSSRNALARPNFKSKTPIGSTLEPSETQELNHSEDSHELYNGQHLTCHHSRYALPTINTSVPPPLELPHAMTTPDESAVPAISPTYSIDLEDVPEDREGYFYRRPSKVTKHGHVPTSSISPQKSMKTLQSWSSRSTFSDNFSLPCSPLHVSAYEEHEHIKPILSNSTTERIKLLTSQFKDLSCSWEDDIDYCYEHAAEADCDFNWQRTFEGDGGIPSSVTCLPVSLAISTTSLNNFANGQNYTDKSFASSDDFTFRRSDKTDDDSKVQPNTMAISGPNELHDMNSPTATLIDETLQSSKSDESTIKDCSFFMGASSPLMDAMAPASAIRYNELVPLVISHSDRGDGQEIFPKDFVASTCKRKSHDSTTLALPSLNNTRLSKSSSFDSILKPYSEFPISYRDSKPCLNGITEQAERTIAMEIFSSA